MCVCVCVCVCISRTTNKAVVLFILEGTICKNIYIYIIYIHSKVTHLSGLIKTNFQHDNKA